MSRGPLGKRLRPSLDRTTIDDPEPVRFRPL